MRYRVEWTKGAAKDRKRLDATMRAHVDAAVAELAENPRPRDARPVISEPGTWRIRVGDYRVLYTIDDDVFRVLILRVKPRGGAYD